MYTFLRPAFLGSRAFEEHVEAVLFAIEDAAEVAHQVGDLLILAYVDAHLPAPCGQRCLTHGPQSSNLGCGRPSSWRIPPSPKLISKLVVRVLVDTNVLGGADQRPLENNVMRRLLDETRRGNLKLVVPELVVREAANLWTEKVGEQMRAARGAQLFLLAAGLSADEPYALRDLRTIRGQEEVRLREVVSAAGGGIAPLPQAGHDRVIERALERRRPFDSNGRNGYRDVILWESLLELDPMEGPVVFLTRDKRAFFEDAKSEKGLAHSLREDAEASFGLGGVALYFDPEQGIAAALFKGVEEERQAAQSAADAGALRRLNELLKSDPTFAAALVDAVSEALDYFGLGGDLRPYGISTGEVYDSHIEAVGSLEKERFLDAHVAEDGAILATWSAEVVALAEATMHPSVATLLADEWRVYMRDQGLGSGMAAAEIEVSATVLVDLVIDIEAARLAAPATIAGFEPLSHEQLLDLSVAEGRGADR